MKISYLILAHNNPNHFHRLLNSLQDKDVFFFVHIDRKSDIGPFTIPTRKDTVYCEKRFPVHWGEFSIVDATIELLKTAKKTQKSDYYILLSGSDYPLRSNEHIREFLIRKKETQFINSIRIPNEEAGKPLSRLEEYHPGSRKISDRLLKLLNSKFNISTFKPKRDIGESLGEITPYGGSQWWALTDEAITYILDFIDKNKSFVRFFENTFCPDELFFQTILCNSKFKKDIQGNITFIDWSAGGKSPEIINETHIENFNNHDVFMTDSKLFGRREIIFARKFPDTSEKLISALKR